MTDPAITLKEIEPFVDRIEIEASIFEEEAALADYVDQLTQDLAVTIHVALIKFRHGDFL